MPKFEVEDTVTGKKFEFEGEREPTQTEVENYVFGTITAGKPSGYREAQRNLLGEETAKLYKGEEIPLALQSSYNWLSRQMDRPAGAMRALANIKNPVEGFLHPEKIPSANASKAWGITEPVQAKLVDFFADTALNLGAFHLAYNVLPRVASIPYVKAQTKELSEFKSALRKEFTAAGMGEVASAQSAEVTTEAMFEQMPFLRKTPWMIKKSTDALKSGEGKLGQMIKDYAFTVKDNSIKLGHEEWMQRATQETARLNNWLEERVPTQRPELNVPLHPAPAVSLDYADIPQSISKDLPTDVIAPPTIEEVTKILSRFPQKVVDQKSLEEVGNAMAKEMGIISPIKWTFKTQDKKYISGRFSRLSQDDKSKPDSIIIRIPSQKLTLAEQKEVLNLKAVGGVVGDVAPTQGKIKKMIMEELVHKLNPGQQHNTIFQDEFNYHEAATLIKRELRKKALVGKPGLPVETSQVLSPSVSPKDQPALEQAGGQTGSQAKLGAPVVQSKSFAGYKVPRGVLVFDVYGKSITTFENEAAAKRWIDSAEKEKQKLVFKEKTQLETKITLETLLDNPDRAAEVIAKPEGHDPQVVNLAQQIELDIKDESQPQVPLEEVKGMSEEGKAVPQQLEDIKKTVHALSTQDLEKLIDIQYELGAPQEALDLLETEYATRVSEEEFSMSEEAFQGASVQDQLVEMYNRYLHPKLRNGMDEKDILDNIRAVMEHAGMTEMGGFKGATDQQLFDAAKDAYEYKKALLERQKNKPVISPTESGVYNPTQNYNVTYLDVKGQPKITTIKGDLLNTVNNTLSSGKNTVDPYGHLITKLVDVFPVKGDSGRFLLPEWEAAEDFLTNVYGGTQVAWEKSKGWFKSFAIPEKVNNPLFKQIYSAVQMGMDYNTELKITGLKLLNTAETLKGLSEVEKTVLTGVAKVGNALKIEYTSEQLKTQFGLSDKQIAAYNNLRRFYRYAFNIVEKAKKIQGEYEGLNPQDKSRFDTAFAKTKESLKGYISQERLGSGEKPWAVYIPPLEGETLPQFFSVFENKADAERTAKALGNIDYAYLRKNIVHKVIQRISLADLEELLDSAGVEDTIEANALRDELKKRGVLHHEVRRLDIPGYEWNWDNIINSAIDYAEGAANRLSRTFGKKLADGLYQRNAPEMSTDMKIFSRDFIDAAYNSGNIGFRNVSKALYTMNLALNTKNLALNLTQPITRTYPFMARYLGSGDCEATFLKSYQMTTRYLKSLITKESPGFSSDLTYSLNKLHNQGVLGDQATRLMMGVSSIKGEQLEKILGAYGRFGEFINRTHAAISAYHIGTTKLKLEGKPLVEFMRAFTYRTQTSYGKHNLPLILKQAGRLNSFVKMLYTFQHYNLDNLQYLNSTMPWSKGVKAGETFRALGALVVLGGALSLPFLGTGKMLYKVFKKVTGEGGTLEDDMRNLMSIKGVPEGMQDTILGGVSSLVGADMTASIRPDLPFVDPSGNISAGGAIAGLVDKIYQAGVLLSRGEVTRAVEKTSPRVVESVMKAIRVNREGLKTQAEVPIVPQQNFSWWDKAMIALGFQPKVVAKAYTREEVERSLIEANRNLTSGYYNKLAQARIERDHKKALSIYKEIHERNQKLPRESRIHIDSSALQQKVNLLRGRGGNVPRKMRRRFRELEKTYGGRR